MNDQLKRAFDAVVAEDRIKENTKNYLHYRLYGKYRRTRNYGRLAVAFCLVLLLGIGGHGLYFTPVSFISIDINPSIELGLNRLDRIISVTPFNVDGVENLELKNRKYDEAILMLLDSREMSSYVTEDSQISISVVSEYSDKNEEIQERVMACTEKRYENVSCHSSSEGVVESAHHEGVSFGKYQAFLELQSLYPDITIEDIRNLTMRQIQDKIDAYSYSETDSLKETTRETKAGDGKADEENDDTEWETMYDNRHGHGHNRGGCRN